MNVFTVTRRHGILSYYELEQLLGETVYCENFDYTLSDKEKAEIILNKETEYYIGVLNRCGRGFELCVFEDRYEVMVNCPSTLDDWQQALSLLAQLSKYENNLIIDEEGNQYDENTIFDFDYYLDIELGLDKVYKLLFSEEYKYIQILGIHYSQFFNKDLIKAIYAGDDLLVGFTEFMRNAQWLNGEIVEQRILQHEKTDELSSFYPVFPGFKLILPIRPVLDVRFQIHGVEAEQVKAFKLLFFNDKSELIAEIPHDYFEQVLNEDEYTLIDAVNIVTEELSLNRLEDIVKGVEVKYGKED